MITYQQGDPEPGHGALLQDREGDYWHRNARGWMCSHERNGHDFTGPAPWRRVLHYAPLTTVDPTPQETPVPETPETPETLRHFREVVTAIRNTLTWPATPREVRDFLTAIQPDAEAYGSVDFGCDDDRLVITFAPALPGDAPEVVAPLPEPVQLPEGIALVRRFRVGAPEPEDRNILTVVDDDRDEWTWDPHAERWKTDGGAPSKTWSDLLAAYGPLYELPSP